ncbi:MAG: undecaprenyl-diphosphate phosphatase [Gemmatimonadetes bacterium]|nr:undecaprenyl-diphosphate phosphatase [Gemmatimonadota bacterium]NIO33065.1 undecaprenyl-diphosphate phosphatase [Gemmatimonadota bacterium]
MSVYEAILLGIVQGLTEFFPVSSSGHLVLAEALLNVNPPGVVFEVMVHLATLCAVLVLYRRRIVELILGGVRRRPADLRYLGMLGVASLPAALLGTTLSGAIAGVFDLPLVVAVNLLLTGGVVYSIRWLVADSDGPDPGWKGSLRVGIAQALALLPGISRSGLTVAAALHAGTKRETAAEFSFLLSVPAILGAAAFQIPKLDGAGAGVGGGELLAAASSAFFAGVVAILLFLRWLSSGCFHRFAFYCWTVGGAYIVYALVTT